MFYVLLLSQRTKGLSYVWGHAISIDPQSGGEQSVASARLSGRVCGVGFGASSLSCDEVASKV